MYIYVNEIFLSDLALSDDCDSRKHVKVVCDFFFFLDVKMKPLSLVLFYLSVIFFFFLVRTQQIKKKKSNIVEVCITCNVTE